MYVELNCRSNFSFLRGASDARDYIARAHELGMPALGIADLNGVYGIPRAYEATRSFPGIKLIVGAELTLSDHPNVTLLAQTRAAYGLLCRMLTHLHAGKKKGEGHLTLHEFTRHLADPRARELVALPEPRPTVDLHRLKEIFGKNLYLPLCRHLDGLDAERTRRAVETSQAYEIPLVATNDVHYHVPERKRLQDCLACIREGVTLRTAGKKIFKNNERYLKSPLEMRRLFRDLPQAIEATLAIAESCTFKLSELTYTYPNESVPAGQTPQSYLTAEVLARAQTHYHGAVPVRISQQIAHELKLIGDKNYASYFLTIFDIVEYAKSKNILCQGRGSAANSITCFFLGITAINPVDMNLLFERFISEERAEPPDIDVDFEHERREEILQYVYARYGREHAGMVAAVRTYRSKSAFLEISKAFGIPVGVQSANALKRDFGKVAGKDAHHLNGIQDLVAELEDFPRHLSIHSGGFTLSRDPIIETVPIEPARMENRTIIQWDKNDLDTVGLLKLDLLSLGFLTALHKCCETIGLDWRKIPSEDRATYAMIQRAETEGCFQIESRAQKSMLPRTLPQNFYDLVVQVAIVRPGPNMGEMITPYLKRREAVRRGTPYRLPDPELESALGRTYGIPIFQEQIMQVAIIKAGFTPGEADELRRAIAAWRSAERVEVVGRKLYQGLLNSGITQAWADELFGYLKGYAHYGFPESHAASFASIAYKSAYLKCHHPAEFLCALVNSQPMGFYAIDTLILEAKRNGVKVLPIHPNRSDWDARMEGPGTVRMGFRNVRRIREEDVRWMNEHNERELNDSDIQTKVTSTEIHAGFLGLEAARKRAPFSGLYDFIQRTRFSKEVIELLAMADVFACFGADQRQSYWQSLEFKNLLEKSPTEQLPLFSENPGAPPQTSFTKLTLFESIAADYRAAGYSVEGNPMTALRKTHLHWPKLTSREARNLRAGTFIEYAGILTVLQRPPTAKGTAFITLEDDQGSLDLILKKAIFEQFEHIIRNSRFIGIKGRIQRVGSGVSVLVQNVHSLQIDGQIEGASQKSISHGATNRTFGSPLT